MSLVQRLQDPQIKQYCQNHNVGHLRLTGSFADGSFDDDSDIDIVYEFDDSQSLQGRGPVSVKVFLEEKLEKSVDMIDKACIPPTIQSSIFSSLIPLR